MDITNCKRIIVIGNNGSGKSYLSKKLSEILDLPLIHLDLEYWGHDWKPTPSEVWQQKQIELTSMDEWIIDGNHTSSLDIRFQKTDLVIFLDIDRLTCLFSVIKRLGEVRTDMPSYLKNRFDLEFLGFLVRLWRFNSQRMPTILELHKKYNNKRFIVIKSRKMMNLLIKELSE